MDALASKRVRDSMEIMKESGEKVRLGFRIQKRFCASIARSTAPSSVSEPCARPYQGTGCLRCCGDVSHQRSTERDLESVDVSLARVIETKILKNEIVRQVATKGKKIAHLVNL